MSSWYYRDRNDRVVGPLSLAELREAIKQQPGPTPVSRSGAPDWKPLHEWTEREPEPTTTPEEPDLKPTLERFRRIVRFATDRALLREHRQYLDQYDPQEQNVLLQEIRDRNLPSERPS